MNEAGGRLGAAFTDDATEPLRVAFEEMFETPSFVALRNVVHTKSAADDLAVGDLTTTQVDAQQDSSNDTITQTAAILRSEALRLPRFALDPRSLGTRLEALMGGGQDIRLEGHPQFARLYQARGIPTERVRAILQPAVLDYFVRHPGFAIRGDAQRLVVYRPGQECDPGALPALVNQAREILALFERAASVAPAEPRASAREPDLRAEAEHMTGRKGVEVRRDLVTRADVDRFLAMPCPRRIPQASCGER